MRLDGLHQAHALTDVCNKRWAQEDQLCHCNAHVTALPHSARLLAAALRTDDVAHIPCCVSHQSRWMLQLQHLEVIVQCMANDNTASHHASNLLYYLCMRPALDDVCGTHTAHPCPAWTRPQGGRGCMACIAWINPAGYDVQVHMVGCQPISLGMLWALWCACAQRMCIQM